MAASSAKKTWICTVEDCRNYVKQETRPHTCDACGGENTFEDIDVILFDTNENEAMQVLSNVEILR